MHSFGRRPREQEQVLRSLRRQHPGLRRAGERVRVRKDVRARRQRRSTGPWRRQVRAGGELQHAQYRRAHQDARALRQRSQQLDRGEVRDDAPVERHLAGR